MKYPIGIQTFEEIITGGYVYVDKTALVYNLVDTGKYYFLSRPRRFGKSLLTTTLESYFLGRKDLFKGLAIEAMETEWLEYPVFHLDFTGESYISEETVLSVINQFLTSQEAIFGKEESETTMGLRFNGVVTRAFKQTGRQAVILIDEYDKPLTDTIGQPELQEKIRSILQGLYGIMKKADRYIRFAFLTGVTRYGKLGIFSAANNPQDISMNDDFASICGITEEELRRYFDAEVEVFAKKQHVDKYAMYEMLKQKYDGYHFSSNSEDIYNPFSLLNSLKTRSLSNYWFATGTPTYLVTILKKKSYDLSKFSRGVTVMVESMTSFGSGDGSVIAALYQSGYLTIKSYDGKKYYRLGFPNEEVEDGFVQCLMEEYTVTTSGEIDEDLQHLGSLISMGDINGFMTQIQQIMSQIPFESNEPKLIEANFRNMLYLMIRSTGHKVLVEYPVLGGRIDVFFQTEEFAYVIECKRDQSAAEALAQIDEKKYADKLSVQNKKIVKIGVNFSTEERNLTEWKEG